MNKIAEIELNTAAMTYSGIDGVDCTNDEKIHFKITKFLYSVGVSITSIGFYYFVDAINICVQDRLAATNAQKNIYMVIADKYGATHKSVERAMRSTFTEVVALRATQLFKKDYGLYSECKGETMTLIEFVCLVSFYLRMQNELK